MARTKDRYLKVLRHPYEPVVLLRKYRAAGYLRLSEDSERKQSDSIENQRYMINQYAKEHEDIEIVMFFEDDGFTGTNFHRSGFEQMMDAVRNGEIDCIIVKDVSRFGREHIQVGDYIDKVFPFLGVRFISIMDYYDSINPDCDRERMILSIKSLVHEMYPRDISRKVHSTFRAKRERGEVRRSNGIPYGFYMEAGDTSYRIDYKTYRIYKKIVGWYVAGCALKDIVRLLFKRGILTPSQYRKTGLVYQNDTVKANIWVKVRINAYGKNTDDVKKDSHIWKVIERLQKQNDDFDEAKQLLILYLSTLLKMDWERSKEEIKGNTYKIVLYFVTLATEIVYCYIYLVELKISSNLMFIGSIIIMMLPIILPERTGINLDDAIEWVKGKENIFFHKFIKTMCICLLLFIGSILLECLFDSILMKWTEFWLPMVLLFVGFTIRYLYEYRKYLSFN